VLKSVGGNPDMENPQPVENSDLGVNRAGVEGGVDQKTCCGKGNHEKIWKGSVSQKVVTKGRVLEADVKKPENKWDGGKNKHGQKEKNRMWEKNTGVRDV